MVYSMTALARLNIDRNQSRSREGLSDDLPEPPPSLATFSASTPCPSGCALVAGVTKS